MATYTVRNGRRYQAKIRLGLFQSVASNEQVADKFRDVGFTDVSVSGSGRDRMGTGLWPHPDATAEIPDEKCWRPKPAIRQCPPPRP
jgi:hypothetical protein